MNTLHLRSVVALAAFAVLTACGGSAPDQADAAVSTAAMMGYAPAPVADCDAEGSCNGPRIIDGIAEQYRASAIAAQQAEQQQALQPAPAVVLPLPLPLPLPGQEAENASEAPSAVGGQAQ